VGELEDLGSDDFVELYRHHYPRLVRSLALAGASPQQAEDLAQEAFARVLGRWRRIRGGPHPAGYVYRVGFRLLAKTFTRRREHPEPAPAGARSPDRPEEEVILARTIEDVLAALPPRQRACAVCCFVLGLTPAEAGQALGIKPSTVRKHLEPARQRLGARLRT
jgi:RNA polymerase sigma factor (sigma-70 family)